MFADALNYKKYKKKYITNRSTMKIRSLLTVKAKFSKKIYKSSHKIIHR